MDDIPLEAVSDMLLMLSLMPQPNQRRCDDLDYLNHLISNKNFRNQIVCQSIQGFILYLSHFQHLKQPQWLYSVPLFHLLSGRVTQFQGIELNPREIPWKGKEIELSKIRSETYGMPFSRDLDHIYDTLSSLFELDPNLLYNFVYICPRNNLYRVFLKTLPYISMSFVAYQLEKCSRINKEEVI